MSNPGVIILDTKKKNIIQRIFNRNSFRYVQIEDNIGEAIHIHFDDFRIELSIKEFFEISSCFKEALNQVVDIKNFDINEIDPLFFKYASINLEDLESIEITTVHKNDVSFLLNNNKFNFYKLNKFKDFTERDLFKINKEKRTHKFYNNNIDKKNILKNLNKDFKPILDEDFIVRDGKHRLFLKFQTNDTSEAYIWRFKNKSFKINIFAYYFVEILNRTINKLKYIIKKFLQKTQNFYEKFLQN